MDFLVSEKGIQEDLGSLSTQLRDANLLFSQVKEQNPLKDQNKILFERLKKFCNQNQQKVKTVKDSEEQMRANFQNCVHQFGEDPKTFHFEDFFQLFGSFIKSWSDGLVEKPETQKQKQKKN